MNAEVSLRLRTVFEAEGPIEAAMMLLRAADRAGPGPDPAGPEELLALLRSRDAIDDQVIAGLSGDLGEALLIAAAQEAIPSGFAHPGPWLYQVIEGVEPDRLLGPLSVTSNNSRRLSLGLGDGWFYLGDQAGERGSVYTLPSAGDTEQLFDQARGELGGEWAGAGHQLTAVPEALAVRTAYEAGGPEAATVSLLRSVGITWSGPDPSSPRQLLDLLRSPELNTLVRGKQDFLVGRDDDDPTGVLAELAAGDDGIDVIAHENQWLWQAHAIDGPGERPLARIIDYEAGERFGDIDLGDFLFRMVTATVTGPRFASPRPWIARPLSGVDRGRLLGTDPIELDQLRLAHVAVGDGWLYLYRRAAGPSSGTVYALDGPSVEATLELARQDLAGTWA